MKHIYGIGSLFITLPIWFYLLYKILESVHASELMWFLYYIYLPVCLLLNIVKEIINKE